MTAHACPVLGSPVPSHRVHGFRGRPPVGPRVPYGSPHIIAVAHHLVEGGLAPERLLIAGDSGGGGLVGAVLHRINASSLLTPKSWCAGAHSKPANKRGVHIAASAAVGCLRLLVGEIVTLGLCDERLAATTATRRATGWPNFRVAMANTFVTVHHSSSESGYRKPKVGH